MLSHPDAGAAAEEVPALTASISKLRPSHFLPAWTGSLLSLSIPPSVCSGYLQYNKLEVDDPHSERGICGAAMQTEYQKGEPNLVFILKSSCSPFLLHDLAASVSFPTCFHLGTQLRLWISHIRARCFNFPNLGFFFMFFFMIQTIEN